MNARTRSSLLTTLAAGALAMAVAAQGVGAHDDGTTSHLWLDHIKPMKTPGTINTSTNPVDWTKLKGVPAGFADGADDGVEQPGFGLKKLVTIFYINWSRVQRRLKTPCSTGQAIRSIDQQGQPTCTAGPRVLESKVPSLGFMCDSYCTEGSLTLTPGTWRISASIEANSGFGDDALDVDCRLDAGGLSDHAQYTVETFSNVTLSMQLIATLEGNLHASVNCRDNDVGAAYANALSIIAMRLD